MKLFNLLLNLGKFISGDLEISLGFQTHVLNLSEVSRVLLLNLVVLSLGVIGDLVHHFLIVPLHGFNFLSQFVNQRALFVDVVIVILLVHVDSGSVLFHDLLLARSKSILVSLLLLLQLIVAGGVLQHL